jgi:hypothetical protein
MPSFPLGHHAHLQRQANAKRIAHLHPTPPPTHHHAGYEHPDPVDLRGIPALAQGVGGTIPGTQPEQQACR